MALSQGYLSGFSLFTRPPGVSPKCFQGKVAEEASSSPTWYEVTALFPAEYPAGSKWNHRILILKQYRSTKKLSGYNNIEPVAQCL